MFWTRVNTLLSISSLRTNQEEGIVSKPRIYATTSDLSQLSVSSGKVSPDFFDTLRVRKASGDL
ncbi:hypothetical protein GJ744_010853 [Endocarpon pusillum]|uniref:Uncharacterized protein n=1 Tax=Endocarpon pusillum TaxID=364733 RepID=A0A8H7AHI2_9EURO|nr:hypothetical protein GJ744_010853 [Endocarpon pusillum]